MLREHAYAPLITECLAYKEMMMVIFLKKPESMDPSCFPTRLDISAEIMQEEIFNLIQQQCKLNDFAHFIVQVLIS
jgi:hypothetical protein